MKSPLSGDGQMGEVITVQFARPRVMIRREEYEAAAVRCRNQAAEAVRMARILRSAARRYEAKAEERAAV